MQPNRRIPGIYPVIIKHGGDTALKTVWETPKRTVKNKEVRHTRKTVEGNKEMIKKFMLQIFADEGGEGNNGGNEGNSGNNRRYTACSRFKLYSDRTGQYFCRYPTRNI